MRSVSFVSSSVAMTRLLLHRISPVTDAVLTQRRLYYSLGRQALIVTGLALLG